MADYVLAIDQGTTSSRAIVFNHSGEIVSTGHGTTLTMTKRKQESR